MDSIKGLASIRADRQTYARRLLTDSSDKMSLSYSPLTSVTDNNI